MPRPVCLFTGQWADLPLDSLAAKARGFGYDGLELACWGDHFDVERCLSDARWRKQRWELLQDHDLGCFAISTHLVGQAVCDPIDERHKAILPEKIYGDGEPEGVRRRAAEEMKRTARAARLFFDAAPPAVKQRLELTGRAVVNGFTGSGMTASVAASTSALMFRTQVQTQIFDQVGTPGVAWTPEALEPTLFFPNPPGSSTGTAYGDWALREGSAGVHVSLAELVNVLDRLRNSTSILTSSMRSLMDTHNLGWDSTSSTKNANSAKKMKPQTKGQ